MTTTESSDTRTVTAKCYCKAVHYSITLPVSALPIPVHLCHCSICRYVLGALCCFHAPLPKGVSPQFIRPSSMESLTRYSSPVFNGTPYFCSTCGCHIGDACPDDGHWTISTSLFDKDETVFVIKSHVFTESAPGGGLDKWLPRIGDREMKIWNPDDDSAKPVKSEPEIGADGEERLRAQCHCGGVSFTFPRPTQEVIDDAFMKRFVSPVDRSKWVACVDACDDCRLLGGTHVTAWTFVPLHLCEPKISPDLTIGTAKTFVSSPGVLRSFCGTCGATVFYSCDDRRPSDRQNIVDVSVGLLRAPEGVKAENWLTWRAGRVGWMDSGLRYDETLTRSLAEGMSAWGVEEYGEALNFNIG